VTAPRVKRPRGRPPIPKPVQRQRLIEAAWRAFQRSHYERTSVADIVREAGMSSRSFYDHFASKDDLVAEIVEELGAQLLAALEAILREPLEDLQEHADRALRTLLELFPNPAIDLERLGGDAGRRVLEVRRKLVQTLTDRIRGHMLRLHQQGRLTRAPERAEIELLLTGIEGLSVRYYSEGRSEELRALRPTLLRIVVQVLA
jgi:TetR/AcrR family transcriptional repressor of nem operon